MSRETTLGVCRFQSNAMVLHMTPLSESRRWAWRKTEPARAVRSTEITGALAGGVFDGFLRTGEFAIDKAGRFERKQWMRFRVVADFVTGGGSFARDFRQAANIRADLKECGVRAIAGQDFEQLRGRFAGPVVEGQRDSRSDTGAAMYGRREQ